MKLVRFGSPGKEKPGILDENGTIRDLSGTLNDSERDSVSIETLSKINKVDIEQLPFAKKDVRIGPCVSRVGNFIAVGLNYEDHAKESGMSLPDEPVLFNKAPSCIVGPNDSILIPKGATKTDWEIELAIVIGQEAYDVNENNALDYVAGYCICNDITERSYQHDRSGQWMKGKGSPTFGPLGPWLVTKDEMKDVNNLHMLLKVNGEAFQNGSTKTMVFKVPYLVSYISKFMKLMPGDVITTGTPPGVGMGMTPQKFLNPGDVIEASIEGLGTQVQNVVA